MLVVGEEEGARCSGRGRKEEEGGGGGGGRRRRKVEVVGEEAPGKVMLATQR